MVRCKSVYVLYMYMYNIHNVTGLCVLCTLSSNTSPVISPVTISLLYPGPGAIPDSAMAPAAATNVTEGFGFTISWNVPEVDPVFIEGYEVIINRADSCYRKRQEDPIRLSVPANVTSYTFTTDEAFTVFLVSVDGLLRVSGQSGRVPALIETRLGTSEGSELYTEHERFLQSCWLTLC